MDNLFVGIQEHNLGFIEERLLCFLEEMFQIYSDDPSQYLLWGESFCWLH